MKSFLSYCCAALFALIVTCVAWFFYSQESKRLDNHASVDTITVGSAASMSDTVRRVKRKTGGQILGAERISFDGQSINRVKYMDEHGRVRYIDESESNTQDSTSQPSPRGDHH